MFCGFRSGYHFFNGFNGGGIAMMIFWAVLIIAVIYFITKKNNVISTNNNALEILRERYANGEITEEEFIRMKKTLK